ARAAACRLLAQAPAGTAGRARGLAARPGRPRAPVVGERRTAGAVARSRGCERRDAVVDRIGGAGAGGHPRRGLPPLAARRMPAGPAAPPAGARRRRQPRGLVRLRGARARPACRRCLDGGGEDGPSQAQLVALLRAARAAGHASVSVELGGAAATAAWRDAGFVARESRPVFGRARDGDTAALADRIWLTSADEDE